MRPTKNNVFRTGAAAKLDQLELIAALLERDATNNRMLIAELGSACPRQPTGDSGRAQLSRRWRKIARAANGAAHRSILVATAVARNPRLRSALRATYAFAVDFAMVLSVACVAVAALAVVTLLIAPPF